MITRCRFQAKGKGVRCGTSRKTISITRVNRKKDNEHHASRRYCYRAVVHKPSHRGTKAKALHSQDVKAVYEEPRHPRALGILYVLYVSLCFVERTWRFAIPLLVIRALKVFSGETAYEIMTTIGLLSQLAMFTCGVWIGEALDIIPRRLLMCIVLSTQAFAVLLACTCLLCTSQSSASTFSQSWNFYGLVVACIVERVSALGSDVALERDWIVCLVGQTSTQALARANATLRRIDMCCESLGPVLFGVMLSRMGLHYTIGTVVLCILIAIPMELLLLNTIYRDAHSSLVKDVGERKRCTPYSALQTWITYFKQRCSLISVAHVCLYGSILYPGTMMVAYLATVGLGETFIGYFRGACAVSSVVATFIVGILIKWYGVHGAGQLSILCTLIAGAMAAFAYASNWPIYMFLLAVVLSRLGHTSTGISSTQIVQQEVKSSEAGSVSACEAALSSLLELVMYIIVLKFCSTPDKFYRAIVFSIGVLGISNLAYHFGTKKLSDG